MTDYRKLIDAETWAFIDRTNSFYAPDTIDETIEDQRRVYDRMCEAFFAGYPENVSAETTFVDAGNHQIPIRIYRKEEANPAAMVLYFHGGGFVLGGLDSHDDICAEICSRTGYEVVSVDYRLAPEHVHPAAFDDAMAAYEWAMKRYACNIVLSGDSAGGNLAAAVAHASRGHAKRPAGQVLIYPGLGGDHSKGSYVNHAEAPMLTVRDIDFAMKMRAGGTKITGDITYAPLADANFSNLPPTVIITAECDPLSSDGEAYCSHVANAGGRAFWHEERGLVHGYLRARHSVSRARSSFTRIVDALEALGKNEWPY
ncbi:alpha/beta hydrolase [Mesorhizobium sp. SB112]|uniref:alpha/beta hydrolase n=1 Tax=Mesorhizobium sp. SB112 TaxID=3151853 RepID=UPI003265848B